MANNFNDLNEYVDTLCALPSSLYDDKVNVNEVDTNLISTHVTAEDLNNLKSAITTISENVNKINQHLISAVVDDIQIPGAFSVNGSINQSLNQYLANDYIRKNQLIIDDHLVNDSIEKLDDIYLRSKNIFVDGYKISTTSPYNLVSFSQLNLLVNNLSTSFLNTLNDIKNDIDEYIRNLNLNGYANGRYITISGDNKSINCTLSGDGTFIDIDDSGKIHIVPSENEGTYVLKTVNGNIQWGTVETGSTVTNGQYITIGNSGDINCTLTEGNYIRIQETNDDGLNPISVNEATTDNKGVVQLVDSITEENKDSIDLAVSPAAIKNLVFGMEEHILYTEVRPSNTTVNEPNGMMTTSTEGWIKYPHQKSTAFPSMCLAEAWGWTDVITMSEGILKIPITKAYNYTTEGAIELGSYCVFHRITYVELETIGVGATDHVNLIYTLPFGPPTEDGTDIKGVSMIQAHVKPLVNPTSNHSFQVFWKVKGYVYTNINEEWISTTRTEAALMKVSYSNPGDIKRTTTVENFYIPVGATRYTADFWEGNSKTTRSITFTLNKIPNSEGKYTINGLKFLVRSISRYKYPGVWCSIVVHMDNVVVDMKKKSITGIKVGKKTGSTGNIFDLPNITTVAAPTLIDPILFNDTNETKTIVSIRSWNPDPGDDKDIDTHAYFKIKFDSEKIQFIGSCDSWSQGDDVVRNDSTGHPPATDIRFVDISNVTCTYTTISDDIGN